MLVREAKETDLTSINQIEVDIFCDSWSLKSLKESWVLDCVRIWVAYNEQQEIIGYLIFYNTADEGDLARIAVDKKHRRGGVSHLLMNQMWKYCKDQGINRVLLEVREQNKHAIALYKNHGFQALGVRKNYYSNPSEDGIIMEKQLFFSTSI